MLVTHLTGNLTLVRLTTITSTVPWYIVFFFPADSIWYYKSKGGFLWRVVAEDIILASLKILHPCKVSVSVTGVQTTLSSQKRVYTC